MAGFLQQGRGGLKVSGQLRVGILRGIVFGRSRCHHGARVRQLCRRHVKAVQDDRGDQLSVRRQGKGLADTGILQGLLSAVKDEAHGLAGRLPQEIRADIRLLSGVLCILFSLFFGF